MDNIRLNSEEELYSFINNNIVKRLGYGREGICFLMQNNIVLKKLYSRFYPDYALQFKDLDIDSYIFAKSAILLGDYARGVFMDYVNGYNLYDYNTDNINIDKLVVSLKKLVTDTIELSKNGIEIIDFHLGNILYNEECFKIIDTLCYLNLPKYDWTIDNIRCIIRPLYDKLLGIIPYNKLLAKYMNCYTDSYLQSNPDEVIYGISEIVNNNFDVKVNNIAEIKRVLKKNNVEI